jgi:DNA-binding transcriptional MerR regulator
VRIGEVAERSSVNPTTIRYYEEIGLLPPPARTASGYRDYTDSAVDWLSFIRAAQTIGLSLGEIGEVLALRERGDAPCPHVITLIEERAVELAQRIAALQQMRNELVQLAKQARRLPPGDDAEFCHIIEELQIPKATRGGTRQRRSP